MAGRAHIYGWLGLRLTTSDRRTRRSLFLITAVSALVCLAVLGSVAAQAVVQQDKEIEAWRQTVGDRAQAGSHDSGVWLSSATTFPTGTGAELTLLTVASQRLNSRLDWPGLSTFPPSGTLMVSRALAEVEGDTQKAIEQSVALPEMEVGGRTVLADEFLRSPAELIAIKFVSGDQVEPTPDWKPLEAGQVREPTQTPSVTIVALLLIFFASATLLMTVAARFLHHNQPNLAVLRLHGAGRSGVAAVAMVPIVVAAMVGALVGWMLFVATTGIIAGVTPRSIAFVLDRCSVPGVQVLLCLTGVVAVVSLMGLASIALVSRDSRSEIHGEARPQRLSTARLTLLLPAVVLLSLDTTNTRGAVLWWVGVALFLVGVLALGRVLLALISRIPWTRPSLLLGFGILSGSSREAKLLNTPTVAVLFLCALLVPLSSGLVYEDELSQVANADVIVTDPMGGLGQLGEVRDELERDLPRWDTGLVANLSTEVVAADSSEPSSGRHSLWVGGCADLKRFFGGNALECKPGVAYFPTGLEPADGSVFSTSGRWRTHSAESDLIYWVNPNWVNDSAEDVALSWVAISVGAQTKTEAVAWISQRYPQLHVEVPAEYRETQREAGQSLRALVLAAIALVALATLATFTAAASNYLNRRSVYLEHVLRMGLTKRELLASAVIVIVLPLILGGVLVLPSGLAIGSILADGTTPKRYLLLAFITFVGSVAVGVASAYVKVAGLQVRAPQRSLGGGGMAARG